MLATLQLISAAPPSLGKSNQVPQVALEGTGRRQRGRERKKRAAPTMAPPVTSRVTRSRRHLQEPEGLETSTDHKSEKTTRKKSTPEQVSKISLDATELVEAKVRKMKN